MDYFIALWTSIILFTLFCELQSPGLFYFLSVSIGGTAALVALFLGHSPGIQMALCAVVTGVSFLILRYGVGRYKAHAPHHVTNAEALKGKKGVVLEGCTYPATARVKVAGEIWSARLGKPGAVKEGAIIQVMAVTGSHLIIEEVV